MKSRYWLTFVCFVFFSAHSSGANAADWVGSWGAAPLPTGPAFGPGAPPATFSNQTIRQVVRISAGGERVRIRFSNEYGAKPLVIGAARIVVVDAGGAGDSDGGTPVLFGGKPGITIPAGAPYLSDAIELPVKALSSLAISVFFPEDTGGCTCHAAGMQTAKISDAGDFTSKSFTPKQTMQARAFVSGVDVESKAPAKVIVVLGDSISDGVGSTVDANRRWPDLLAERLATGKSGSAWGIVNMGISGNRVLADGAGVSALARFDRDVLSVPGAAYVVVFEGVNDLGISYGKFEGATAERFKALVGPNKATTETITAAYRQIIARAHAKGLKVVGVTITPYEGASYWSAEGEAVRQEINQWIRKGGAFDAVLDFDAVFRDPARPTQIAATLHPGDHLHGSDAGYDKAAKSIDLAIFK
ncbi:MAG: SGNH/GDSL hydrolase family protein [Gammaproteobacteria bacterium]